MGHDVFSHMLCLSHVVSSKIFAKHQIFDWFDSMMVSWFVSWLRFLFKPLGPDGNHVRTALGHWNWGWSRAEDDSALKFHGGSWFGTCFFFFFGNRLEFHHPNWQTYLFRGVDLTTNHIHRLSIDYPYTIHLLTIDQPPPANHWNPWLWKSTDS